MPLVSSVSHFIGGLLHFWLGYSLFSPIDRRAILIAPFFALIFMAGHANQEVQDQDVLIRKGRIRTNAVVFGKTAVFLRRVWRVLPPPTATCSCWSRSGWFRDALAGSG